MSIKQTTVLAFPDRRLFLLAETALSAHRANDAAKEIAATDALVKIRPSTLAGVAVKAETALALDYRDDLVAATLEDIVNLAKEDIDPQGR